MTTTPEPQIVLYDLACTKNVCFSPTVWRIRLMLNYKQIPYKTVFLEFPDIAPTMKELGVHPEDPDAAYTVPVIHHTPTNTYMMDSLKIAPWLEATYPDPPLVLTSELGEQVEALTRSVVGKAFRVSVMGREASVLSPRAEEYFRRTREPRIGGTLESLLDSEVEVWKEVDADVQKAGEMLRSNRDKGPYVLGERLSMTDFAIAAALRTAFVIDGGEGGTFERMMKVQGFADVYRACLPWMARED